MAADPRSADERPASNHDPRDWDAIADERRFDHNDPEGPRLRALLGDGGAR